MPRYGSARNPGDRGRPLDLTLDEYASGQRRCLKCSALLPTDDFRRWTDPGVGQIGRVIHATCNACDPEIPAARLPPALRARHAMKGRENILLADLKGRVVKAQAAQARSLQQAATLRDVRMLAYETLWVEQCYSPLKEERRLTLRRLRAARDEQRTQSVAFWQAYVTLLEDMALQLDKARALREKPRDDEYAVAGYVGVFQAGGDYLRDKLQGLLLLAPRIAHEEPAVDVRPVRKGAGRPTVPPALFEWARALKRHDSAVDDGSVDGDPGLRRRNEHRVPDHLLGNGLRVEFEALNYTCPTCWCDAGFFCQTPTGAQCRTVHSTRLDRAEKAMKAKSVTQGVITVPDDTNAAEPAPATTMDAFISSLDTLDETVVDTQPVDDAEFDVLIRRTINDATVGDAPTVTTNPLQHLIDMDEDAAFDTGDAGA